MLLVGDSWAFFMGVDQTINTMLSRWGHSDLRYYTNGVIAENGAETDDFLTASKQAEIQARIDADPNIRVIHLSIGGNDVLGDWNVDFTDAQTDSLKLAVEERLLAVIDFLKSTRPGMRILWSGYTYPNFGEVISELGPLQSIHPFYGTWSSMGFPTFEQLNTILNDFSERLLEIAAEDPQVDFVKGTGLMQHVYGQNSPLSVPPGGTYAPQEAPLPIGFVDYPSPKSSMRSYGLFLDCFHLSADGYRNLVDLHMQHFYHKFLMHDQWLLSSGGAADGSVSSTGTVSNELKLGEEGGTRFATQLTFNTTLMDQPMVSGARIFLRRQSLSGTNPVGGALRVRVKSGQFGDSPEVEAVDYYVTSDAEEDACRFGSTGGNGHWIRIDLPEDLLPYISTTAPTQFLIMAPDAMGGVVTFTGAEDPTLAPVLDLSFGEIHVGLSPAHEPGAMLLMHPNPTDGLLRIETLGATVERAMVRDMLGRTVLHPTPRDGMLDLSPLPKGTYLVELYHDGKRSTQRIVKW